MGPSENVAQLHAPRSTASAAGAGPRRALSHRRSRVLRDDADPRAVGPRLPADRSRERAARGRHQPAHGRHVLARRGSDRQARCASAAAPPAIVVGVVANVRSQTLTTLAQPEMYVPHAQTDVRGLMYVVKSSLPSAQVLSAARDVVRRLDTRLPLDRPGADERDRRRADRAAALLPGARWSLCRCSPSCSPRSASTASSPMS